MSDSDLRGTNPQASPASASGLKQPAHIEPVLRLQHSGLADFLGEPAISAITGSCRSLNLKVQGYEIDHPVNHMLHELESAHVRLMQERFTSRRDSANAIKVDVVRSPRRSSEGQ